MLSQWLPRERGGRRQRTLRLFLAEHITEPAHNLYMKYLLRKNFRNTLSEEQHTASRESLTRMLEEYMNRAEKAQGGTGGTSGSTNTPSSTAISQSSSRLECSETVAQRAARHDMSVVTNDFEHELKDPLMNTFRGNLVHILLIQVQKLKVDVETEMIAMEAMMSQQDFNMEVMATVPAFASLVAVCKGLSVFWDRLSISGGRHRAYLELRLRLSRSHEMLAYFREVFERTGRGRLGEQRHQFRLLEVAICA
ncbi:hypothetical protein CYMTET_23708 [Cymbomonas tetramitiformis]|uniref:Uncharacterized protein n=1 Tax=Cymbomonas tetramitiformis TaxID=36881 RepID=A0AAE0FYS0_9CHLO|nr:hypothetical protein CYMTET_23708 [Cymbomonas tetramitiformis]